MPTRAPAGGFGCPLCASQKLLAAQAQSLPQIGVAKKSLTLRRLKNDMKSLVLLKEEESEAADKVEIMTKNLMLLNPDRKKSLKPLRRLTMNQWMLLLLLLKLARQPLQRLRAKRQTSKLFGDVLSKIANEATSCGSFDRMLMTEMPNVSSAGGANCQGDPSLEAEDILQLPQQQQQQQPTPQHDFRSPCKQTLSSSIVRVSRALLTQWESASNWCPTSPTSQLADWVVALTGDLKERLDRLEQLVMLEESVLRQAPARPGPLCTTASQSVETCRILLLAGRERRRHYLGRGRPPQEQTAAAGIRRDAVSIASSASSSTAAAASAHAIAPVLSWLATLTRIAPEPDPAAADASSLRHHFACLLLCPEGRVIATELVSATLPDAVSSSKPVMLEIPNCVSVNQLKYNFQIMLSIYWMPALDDPAAAVAPAACCQPRLPCRWLRRVAREARVDFLVQFAAVSPLRRERQSTARTHASQLSRWRICYPAASMLASLEQAEAAGFQLVGETCLQLRDIVGATAEADAAAASLLTLRRPSTTSFVVASTAACPLATQLGRSLARAACPLRVLHRVVGDLAAWARLWTVLNPGAARGPGSQPEDSEQGLPCLQSIVGIAPEEVCVRRHTLSLRLAGSASQTDNLLLLNCEISRINGWFGARRFECRHAAAAQLGPGTGSEAGCRARLTPLN
uniref:Anillin domain-containing protein n=1 Tax=Macrostomum lignano TaxID=282301 RepID=A0A1I8FH30_9PLAT